MTGRFLPKQLDFLLLISIAWYNVVEEGAEISSSYFICLIETRVQNWENQKCYGNMSSSQAFQQCFRVSTHISTNILYQASNPLDCLV